MIIDLDPVEFSPTEGRSQAFSVYVAQHLGIPVEKITAVDSEIEVKIATPLTAGQMRVLTSITLVLARTRYELSHMTPQSFAGRANNVLTFKR